MSQFHFESAKIDSIWTSPNITDEIALSKCMYMEFVQQTTTAAAAAAWNIVCIVSFTFDTLANEPLFRPFAVNIRMWIFYRWCWRFMDHELWIRQSSSFAFGILCALSNDSNTGSLNKSVYMYVCCAQIHWTNKVRNKIECTRCHVVEFVFDPEIYRSIAWRSQTNKGKKQRQSVLSLSSTVIFASGADTFVRSNLQYEYICARHSFDLNWIELNCMFLLVELKTLAMADARRNIWPLVFFSLPHTDTPYVRLKRECCTSFMP